MTDKLVFPSYEYKLSSQKGKTTIFDIIRKKHIILTPEEWIRQHLIHYLIAHMNYPKSLISVEDGLKVNKMQKRSDVIVYDRQGKAFLLMECKSAKVKISQKDMDQLSIYNQAYKAQYIALTNGLRLVICKMDYQANSFEFLSTLPEFP